MFTPGELAAGCGTVFSPGAVFELRGGMKPLMGSANRQSYILPFGNIEWVPLIADRDELGPISSRLRR